MLRSWVVALAIGGAVAALAAQPRRPAVQVQVDAIFNRWTAATPGCAVGATVKGEPAVTAAYGMADLEHDVAIAPDTIFEAGSVSKQFTATAVLLLARDGKLKLDDPVRTYIPELSDYGAPLTIRQTWCQCQPGDSRPVTGRSTSSMATAGCVPPTSSAP